MKKGRFGIFFVIFAIILGVGCSFDTPVRAGMIELGNAIVGNLPNLRKESEKPSQEVLYDAYYNYLVENEHSIRPYQTTLQILGGSSGRNISIADYDCDGVDDLFCVIATKSVGGYALQVQAKLLSYFDGEIVTLLSDSYSVGLCDTTSYAWFMQPSEGTLCSMAVSGDSPRRHQLTTYRRNLSGKYTSQQTLTRNIYEDGSVQYLLDSKQITADKYAQKFESRVDRSTLILLEGSGKHDEYFERLSSRTPVAMTYNEALQFLKPGSVEPTKSFGVFGGASFNISFG